MFIFNTGRKILLLKQVSLWVSNLISFPRFFFFSVEEFLFSSHLLCWLHFLCCHAYCTQKSTSFWIVVHRSKCRFQRVREEEAVHRLLLLWFFVCLLVDCCWLLAPLQISHRAWASQLWKELLTACIYITWCFKGEQSVTKGPWQSNCRRS